MVTWGVPLTLATSLETVGLVRCRECAAYLNPHATHSECVLRDITKAGYAAACKQRVPRGQALPNPALHKCLVCGAELTRPNAKYCGEVCKWKHAKPAPAAASLERWKARQDKRRARICENCGSEFHPRPTSTATLCPECAS